MVLTRRIVTACVVMLLLGTLGIAQGTKERVKQLTPTHKGSTGLFNLFVADTLRQGEFSIGLNVNKFNRDPGDLDFTIFPASFTVGLHDRIELFGSYEVYKRVNADQIRVHKTLPGGPIGPAQVPNGTIAFYNDAPFMDVGFGDGSGDLWAGVKFNLLSERMGAPLSLAIQPIARFHLTDDREHLARGLTAGATDYGFDFVLSKAFGRGGTFTGNAGMLIADDILNIDRQDRFNWGVGLDVPLGTNAVHAVGEILGSVFYGSRDTSDFTNVRSPVDVYAGLRTFPARWLSISGAYNIHLNRMDGAVLTIDETDRHGFYAQVALQRKINEPPVAECTAEQTTVTEGDSVTIRTTVNDPDDDTLSITWQASGGKLDQQNGTAVLDTTGLEAGRYSVKAEVSDGDNVASCSADITVEKRMLPPTITCQPSSVSVTEGDSITLNAQASDPNDDPLTYSWTVNGQSITNDSPTFEFGTEGRSPGQYTVAVTVTDVDNMSASCEFTVTVDERPNRQPTVSLQVDPTEVFAGDTVTATADANDPDGDPLSYSWSVDGQSRPGSDSQLTIDTSGMTGGSHSVSVTVNDGRGGSASDTQSFSVTEKIIIPVNRIEPDNAAKAQLDEIALKLQQNPQLRARITGHTDDRGSEEANQRVGQRRADAAKNYLVQQHNIDESRIEATSAGESSPIGDNTTEEGRRQNRRVEVELFVQ